MKIASVEGDTFSTIPASCWWMIGQIKLHRCTICPSPLAATASPRCLPSLSILRAHGVLDADEVLDNVALAPVGDAVVGAASGCGMGAAALADVLVYHLVSEAVEGAVVGGPAVLDARVSETHVVEELVLEVLEQHRGARELHEVDVFVAVYVVAGGQREEHVEMVGVLAHLAGVFVEVFRAHIPERLVADVLHEELVGEKALGDDFGELGFDDACLEGDVFARHVFVELEDGEPPADGALAVAVGQVDVGAQKHRDAPCDINGASVLPGDANVLAADHLLEEVR